MSVANSFLGGSKGTSKVPKQAAVDLLKKSPLEMKASDGQAHLVGNPLAFTSLQYPRNLGVDGGHFIIFYSISNNKSLDKDTEFNKKIGVSIDSEHAHWAWRREQKELKELPFPLVSDLNRQLSTDLGILDKSEGVSQRATYIVDPEDNIRFVMVNDLDVGRNPKEVLRVLDALQTDELCPCNWKKGEETIDVNVVTAKNEKQNAVSN